MTVLWRDVFTKHVIVQGWKYIKISHANFCVQFARRMSRCEKPEDKEPYSHISIITPSHVRAVDGVLAPIEGPSESPWGNNTASQETTQPFPVRPDKEILPDHPRPYTAIKSYHAHIYFDEDNYKKAARIRHWVIERFPVELGDWNTEPRGPHVSPSFYFGFTTDLFPIVVPWLQLNSLGLTILIHPNTGDPRSDHLHYSLWVNRSQPVNAYSWRRFEDGNEKDTEEVNPNIDPTVVLES